MVYPRWHWVVPAPFEAEESNLSAETEVPREPFYYSSAIHVNKTKCYRKYVSAFTLQENHRRRYNSTVYYHQEVLRSRHVTTITFIVDRKNPPKRPTVVVIQETRTNQMNFKAVHYASTITLFQDKARRRSTAVTLTPGELEVTYAFTLRVKRRDDETPTKRTKRKLTRFWIYRY